MIVIEGADGSGKTSLSMLLKKHMREIGQEPSEHSLFKRSALRAAAHAMNKAGAMTPEVLCGLHYADLTYGVSEMLSSPVDVAIWDRYIYSSATSVRLRGGSNAAWRTLLNDFPHPKLVIILSTDPEVCYERIVSRSGGPTFFECGLDRFYRGERLAEALRKFESRQHRNALEKEAFLDFMGQWNESVEELTIGTNRKVIKNFDLKNAAKEIDGIIDLLPIAKVTS